MTVLSRSLFHLRRGFGRLWGLLLALAAWPALAQGWLPPAAFRRGDWVPMAIILLLAVAMVRLVVREMSGGPSRFVVGFFHEVEAGILPITGLYLLIAATGGLASPLYPLLYLLVSLLMVLQRDRWAATSWLVTVGVLEWMVWHSADSPERSWRPLAIHLSFVLMFATANVLVLSGLVGRLRASQRRQVQEEIERMRQEARDFRLIASQLPLRSRQRGRDEEELRMAQGAVESIHTHLFHTLELLRTTLDLQTSVLLWMTDPGKDPLSSRNEPIMAIKEVATVSDALREQATLPALGPLAGVARTGNPLRLKALAGARPLPYYEGGGGKVTDLCVVPLMDGASLRGLLCADRVTDRPFTDAEEICLAQAAAHLLRVIEHERVFAAVERGKYEQEQFYRASELLNQALTVEDVYRTSFLAIRAIAGFDLAVITSYDGEFGTHRVLAVEASSQDEENRRYWADMGDHLRGLEFGEGAGLVAMSIKNRHYMPASAELTDGDTVVFTPRTRLRRARSVLVLPLVRGEQVLGAIVLAASRPRTFPAPIRDMLGVISNQVTVSLQNARLYQSMEHRATTDGLTGLTNHRAFQERLEQLHALSERTGQRYSVILTDIDHFKSINDTYGHPVGDLVLKRVAATFVGRVRKVDIVARYGGEEFVLVLPDTDAAGAAHFANRLREEVAATTMVSDHGSFNITISMGVAQFPTDGKDRQVLIERADQALYEAKSGGRNCVKRWSGSV